MVDPHVCKIVTQQHPLHNILCGTRTCAHSLAFGPFLQATTAPTKVSLSFQVALEQLPKEAPVGKAECRQAMCFTIITLDKFRGLDSF